MTPIALLLSSALTAISVNHSGTTLQLYGTQGNDHIEFIYDGTNYTAYDNGDVVWTSTTKPTRLEVHTYGGNDWIWIEDESAESYFIDDVYVETGTGNDTVVLYGGIKDAEVIGNSGNNDIEFWYGLRLDVTTGGGDDWIFSRAYQTSHITTYDGDDEIIVEDGRAIIDSGDGLDDITTGSGDDTIDSGVGADVIDSKGGDDKIYAGNGNDTIYAGGGDDTIYGNSGDDEIYGGDGRDYIRGGNGGDEIYGDGNDDEIYGGDGKDKIYGKEGDDYLEGNDGQDKIWGGDGNDYIHGGSGDDDIHGGGGKDTCDAVLLSGDSYAKCEKF